MKNTNKWKKLITLAGIATFSMAAFLCPATTIVAEAATGNEAINPRADIVEWRYKEENGKLYKRLYNYSISHWITDWIYVCDL